MTISAQFKIISFFKIMTISAIQSTKTACYYLFLAPYIHPFFLGKKIIAQRQILLPVPLNVFRILMSLRQNCREYTGCSLRMTNKSLPYLSGALLVYEVYVNGILVSSNRPRPATFRKNCLFSNTFYHWDLPSLQKMSTAK